MKVMAGAARHHMTRETAPQYGQVSQKVEELVADELVGETQAIAVQYTIIPYYDGVFERTAAGQTAPSQALDLIEEGKSARRCYLAPETFRVDLAGQVLHTHRWMAERDDVGQKERCARQGADRPPFKRIVHTYREGNRKGLAGLVAFDYTCGFNRLYEGDGAAVRSRNLLSLHGDLEIIQGHAEKGGHQVLRRAKDPAAGKVKVRSSAGAFTSRLRQGEALVSEGEVKPLFARREEVQARESPRVQADSRKLSGTE
jgi:hypothetical protein